MVNAKAAYDAGIAFLDEQLERVFSELERRGLGDRTLVIVTSDHGEQFGEHGLPEHGNSLYLFVLHVPLVVIYPRTVPPGIRVAMPVSLRDVPATVIDLVGIRRSSPFPGASLRRFWEPAADPAALVEPIASEVTRPTIQSVLVHPFHYIRRAWGKVELYDIVDDYREQRDLSRSPEGAVVVERLNRTLDSIWAAAPAHPSRPPPPRRPPHPRPRSLTP
jgi:arylsulfatase A-like enzyme